MFTAENTAGQICPAVLSAHCVCGHVFCRILRRKYMQENSRRGAAILGAGFISHSHAEALRYCRIRICAVVDRSEEAAKAFAQKWGIETYGTSEELLFSDEITSVHVCTPPHTHYQTVKRLLEAGKHVLCEKPLCLDNAQAHRLASLADSLGLQCGINLNVRFHQMSDQMKVLVQSPDFGTIRLVHGQYLQQFHLLPCPYGWRYIPEAAGPMRAVTEIGTHWFDIVQYITGEDITHVSALFGNFQPRRLVREGIMYALDKDQGRLITVHSEDAALVHFRLGNGAIGSVTLSEVSHGYSNYLAYEITGDGMTAGWNSQDNNSMYMSSGNGRKTVISDGFGNGFNDSFRRLIQSFYAGFGDDMPDDTLPACPTFKEGAKIVRLCNAVYESAVDKNGGWVQV